MYAKPPAPHRGSIAACKETDCSTARRSTRQSPRLSANVAGKGGAAPESSVDDELNAQQARIAEVIGRLSRADLSRLLGINHETVRRVIVKGPPTARVLIRLCTHMNFSADWLLRGIGPMHRGKPIKLRNSYRAQP